MIFIGYTQVRYVTAGCKIQAGRPQVGGPWSKVTLAFLLMLMAFGCLTNLFFFMQQNSVLLCAEINVAQLVEALRYKSEGCGFDS